MKVIETLFLLIVPCTTTFAEQFPPYSPSGWRPEGPAFELPNLQRNLQFNQRQEIPQQGYSAVTSSALQNPSVLYGAAKIQVTATNVGQNQRIQPEGFLQLTPKIHVKQPFRPTHEINNVQNGLSYQQFLEQEMRLRQNSKVLNFNNEYLPSSENQPFPRDNIDVRGGSQQDNMEPFNYNGQFPNNPNVRTELIPNFPEYNPNITHVEDRGNRNRNSQQFSHQNIKLEGNGNKGEVNDSSNNNDSEFGKRIITRKVKVIRRNRKPLKEREDTQENVS